MCDLHSVEQSVVCVSGTSLCCAAGSLAATIPSISFFELLLLHLMQQQQHIKAAIALTMETTSTVTLIEGAETIQKTSQSESDMR